jgi:hypothetical protein
MPTSIIVVDTKIWNFFFKKLSNIISLSFKSVLPCNKETWFGKSFSKYSNFLTADEWSNFLDSSINGQTQKIWLPYFISFLINLITSSILLSSLL